MTIETEKIAALRELADYVWDSDSEWDSMEEELAEKGLEISPEYFILYHAAVAKDLIPGYLETFYEYLENAEYIQTFEVCKDCYDVITCADASVMEDVFIYHYGQERGEQRFMEVLTSVVSLENRGLIFDKEVPELLNTFSKNRCHCCKDNLHGERFFMVYNKPEKTNEIF